MATNQSSASQPTTVARPSANYTGPVIKDIFHAIRRKNLTAVKQFVEEKKEPITITTSDGQKSVAIIAAEYGSLPIMKYVLEKNSTLLRVTDLMGNTVLQNVIQRGDLEMVKYLVEEKNADICAIDHHIQTAVHVAVQEGQMDILKYFIEQRKADVNLRNLNGEPLIFTAAERPLMHVLLYLLEERRADPTLVDLTKDNILYKSARHHDVTVPKFLLDEKKVQFDINWRNTLGYTVSNWASKYNNTEFVKYAVLEKKADVTIPDTKMKRTPLHLAAMTNNVDLCKFLVEHGAKRDAKDLHNHTAAQLASDPELIGFLNSTSGSRKRRNLAETINIPRQEVSMIKNRLGSAYQYQRLVSGNNQEMEAAVAQQGNAAHAFDGFLTMVDTAIRYFMGSSTHQQVEHQSLQSPQEYLSRRMDPVAVDAVERLPVFEE